MSLAEKLRTFTPEEFAVAAFLKEHGAATVDEIAAATGLDPLKSRRAAQWLDAKGFANAQEAETEAFARTALGADVAERGLPERRFLEAVAKKAQPIASIRKTLSDEEFNAAVGKLKRAGAIEMGKTIAITDAGTKLLAKGFDIEDDLAKGTLDAATSELVERGLFEKQTTTTLTVELLKDAAKLDYTPLELVEQLTPDMIRDGEYDATKFRVYDVTAAFPSARPGRRHFINEAADFVRTVWLDMGFEEMKGTMIQTGFWNFDALFTAQDHPARDMQDTFFLKSPASGKLPENKLVSRVAKTHEDGWTTGSSGYGQEWSRREARRTVLRTHTTCISAQTLARLDAADLPAKFFSVDKVFRNETLDWKHLFEFHQVEGIVVDKRITFANLKAYLEIFFRKLGYEKIRLRPAYFPYTEPSVEVDVLHPVRNEWIELGGAGIFRPEVSKPLIGRDYPVAAWGLGFGRIISDSYDITDLREFGSNDLEQLRHAKGWL